MKSWWKAVLAYPPTWVAIVAVLVAEWAIFSWFQPPAVLVGILIALGVVAIMVWPITMSATGTLSRLQFEIPKLSEVDQMEMAKLEKELAALEDTRPGYQLRALQEKRDNLAEVLGRRLDSGELTYARYLTTAQQVYLSALDNLREVAISLKSISTIDDGYIESRLEELVLNGSGESTERERSSLEGRRALRQAQVRKVADLLSQNESAMTAMDKTATALADAPIGRTPEDAEASMAALEELAQRASKYATG
ncbi:MAG TPA: hypothetical protein VLT15_03780 [Acidimicrobiia bacterium]|nr:hypothetical protein [Acidimicrobiia bacterium]